MGAQEDDGYCFSKCHRVSPTISQPDHLAWQVGKEAIVLAKKTGSTDNLTGHLGTAKSTDCLIKEVP